MSDYSPILQRLEAEDAATTERVRQMLYAEGRPDLVAKLDAKLRDIETGVYSARNCWHSISPAQRRVLADMARCGGHLWQSPINPNAYHLRIEMGAVIRVGRPTVRALAAHGLLAWEGGAFTPEAKATLTERGLFVLRHGAQP